MFASIREIPYEPQNEGCVAKLQHAKLHLNALIQEFQNNEQYWSEERVHNIFLQKSAPTQLTTLKQRCLCI